MSDVRLITEHCNAGRLDEARACFARLEQRALDRPRDPRARAALAEGAVNMIYGYGRSGRLQDARTCVERLEALAADHPGEPALHLHLARGVFNLLNDLGDAGRFARGERMPGPARPARRQPPPMCPAIRLELAKGAFNLMNDSIRAGRLEEARSYLARLGRLANDHPEDIEVRLRVGRAAVNLIKTFATAGRRDEAMAIARRVPPDPGFARVPQARAATFRAGGRGAVRRAAGRPRPGYDDTRIAVPYMTTRPATKPARVVPESALAPSPLAWRCR